MQIKIVGKKSEIALLEEIIDKSQIFKEVDSSRVWGAGDGGWYKRIDYSCKAFEAPEPPKPYTVKQEPQGHGFMNIPDGIDEELPFN